MLPRALPKNARDRRERLAHLILQLLAALTLPPAAHAHVVSISSSEIHITGRTASLELRMPAYEITHVANPATELLDQLSFTGARRTASDCNRRDDMYICTASYEFESDIAEQLDVACTLFKATVPNHIHMLYAEQNGNSDQVVFDQSTTRRTLRLHAVTFGEIVTRDGGAGARRFLSSLGAILFLAALALAARSWREAAVFGALLLAAEWLVRPLVPFLQVGLSPDFLEALLALTAAYLAAEVFFLPGRSRGAVIAVLALAHGLPFAGFPAMYLAGANTIQVILIAALAFALFRLTPERRRTAALVVLAASAGWFTSLLMR